MKKVLVPIFSLALFLFLSAPQALAAPFGNEKNPNIVANYDSGIHTIVGEQADVHTGLDVVMKAGNSGNFQQWFYGTSQEEGLHGDHSVWRVEKKINNNDNWVLVENPNPSWGDYLLTLVNYLVKTNDFRVTK